MENESEKNHGLRELSLFSGAGGGLLASHLLGWRTIGYVEFNDYCQRVIAQRIEDGLLYQAPIFGDIRAFISEGYAEQYQGLVDVVSGGFPCQPFSVAGKQAAADDPRNMWPAILEVIRLVRPRFAFLENVPGLLASSHGYFGDILSGLAEVGYDARWCVLSAQDCGAPHQRRRLWMVAHNDRPRQQDQWRDQGEGCHRRPNPCVCGERRSEAWWQTEPALDRVADGVPDRVAQLKAAGNGQVPIVAATAWRLLTQ